MPLVYQPIVLPWAGEHIRVPAEPRVRGNTRRAPRRVPFSVLGWRDGLEVHASAVTVIATAHCGGLFLLLCDERLGRDDQSSNRSSVLKG